MKRVARTLTACACVAALSVVPTLAFAATGGSGTAKGDSTATATKAADKVAADKEVAEGEEAEEEEIVITPEAQAWYDDTECADCHEKQAGSFEDEKALASTHAALDIECSVCHADLNTLSEVHDAIDDKTDLPTALTKTAVDTEKVCATCHDVEALPEATEDSEVLTDSEGTVVNPHDLPENDSHDAAETDCVSCHKVHSTTALEKTATRYCKSCHHANVYECNTCHSA
jgi:hypothetical protein